MFENRTPPGIILGGFGLAAIAGMVNAVGFLGAYHQAFSHLSGTATHFAADLAQGHATRAALAGLLLISFLLGATTSGLIIRDSHLQPGRRYGVALVIEGLILFAAVPLLQRHLMLGGALAAAACGLQNAMATTYSGAIVRTTHVTGIVTDLGLALSHRLRRSPGRAGRTRLLAALLAGFLVGGSIGASLFDVLNYRTLWVPATVTIVAGCTHVVMRQFKFV
ncbi:YoaK family protein [Synoicihabitans lomoniglobus]|uniref:YoaK family protein n=1 Tax=Synoicihabitans lomoniglobus TaxID=2909285 RepID=A0AAE9ZTZ4_9BACT|nr:DUF1275 domain-containing protein [Opitutaceae bacterium LMO-M01]WED63024.1 YoaK family protein [Opitutaceae bacterium LMO-M01]